MTPIKYYTDEHISKAIIKGLQARGVDVLSCQEAGMRTASDEEHLAFANENGRVIFTYDADFIRLHTDGFEHAGIVYSSKQGNIGEQVRNLKLIAAVLTAEEMVGQIEFI